MPNTHTHTHTLPGVRVQRYYFQKLNNIQYATHQATHNHNNNNKIMNSNVRTETMNTICASLAHTTICQQIFCPVTHNTRVMWVSVVFYSNTRSTHSQTHDGALTRTKLAAIGELLWITVYARVRIDDKQTHAYSHRVWFVLLQYGVVWVPNANKVRRARVCLCVNVYCCRVESWNVSDIVFMSQFFLFLFSNVFYWFVRLLSLSFRFRSSFYYNFPHETRCLVRNHFYQPIWPQSINLFRVRKHHRNSQVRQRENEEQKKNRIHEIRSENSVKCNRFGQFVCQTKKSRIPFIHTISHSIQQKIDGKKKLKIRR